MEVRGRKVSLTLKSDKGHRGFTLIETLIVILMSMTLMAISIFQVQPAMQLFRSRAATDQVKSTLRQARELAISERRSVVIQFVGNNTIQLFEVVEPANATAATPFLTVPLESGGQFLTLSGETDTPDGFG